MERNPARVMRTAWRDVPSGAWALPLPPGAVQFTRAVEFTRGVVDGMSGAGLGLGNGPQTGTVDACGGVCAWERRRVGELTGRAVHVGQDARPTGLRNACSQARFMRGMELARGMGGGTCSVQTCSRICACVEEATTIGHPKCWPTGPPRSQMGNVVMNKLASMRPLKVALVFAAGSLLLQMVAVPVLVELRFHSLVETVYAPAFAFAAFVTPDAWGFQGNVLLGFGWLVFSAISYSVAVALLAGAAALLANQRLQSTSDARG